MAYSQGAIVVADDPFGTTPKRPYLVVSNSKTPFHGEEYLGATITTTAREAAIELTPERFETGRLPRTSYVSPWTIVTLKDVLIEKQPANATTDTVDAVRDELKGYLRT